MNEIQAGGGAVALGGAGAAGYLLARGRGISSDAASQAGALDQEAWFATKRSSAAGELGASAAARVEAIDAGREGARAFAGETDWPATYDARGRASAAHGLAHEKLIAANHELADLGAYLDGTFTEAQEVEVRRFHRTLDAAGGSSDRAQLSRVVSAEREAASSWGSVAREAERGLALLSASSTSRLRTNRIGLAAAGVTALAGAAAVVVAQ